MDKLCPKCNGSGFLGEIRGGGETERVLCDCACHARFDEVYQSINRMARASDRAVSEIYANSPQDAPASPDPSATPTQPPAIEPVPDFAANLTILKLQRIAPDYAYQLLTVLDGSGVEHQIFVSTEEK